jgi:tetratricopeptide (TPR) repeat protein
MSRRKKFLLTVFLAAASLCMATTDRPAVLRQVRLLIDRREFTKALVVLNTAKRENGPDSGILYLRGYVLYRLDRLAEAKQQLKEALSLDPQNLQIRYILGRIAQSENQQVDAIHWLEPCARADPPIEDAQARVSKLYWETGQIEQAQAWTEKAVSTTPWDGSLHYRLGRIYQQVGREDLAKKEFAESLKTKAADSEGVQKLMECSRALSSQDMATALKIREEFLKGPTLDPDLLVALGTSFATSGTPEQAIELFQSAATRDPKSFQAQFNLGLAMLNLKRPEEAVRPLEASLGLVPESKQANAALAVAYVVQGKFKEAVAPLETARQADPHDRKTAGLVSLAYYRSGAAAKAIPILRESLGQSKDDPKFYFLLVDCLNATEKQQEALAVASEAVEHFPGLGQAWLGKAQQLARLGKYHEAGPLFAKAAELAPEQVEPLLGLAETQQKDGDYQAALETYQRATAKDGDLTAALGAARSLIFLGRLTEARSILEQSARRNADDSQVHFELSRVYARLGEKRLAEEQTRIVQQLRAQATQTDPTLNAPQ